MYYFGLRHVIPGYVILYSPQQIYSSVQPLYHAFSRSGYFGYCIHLPQTPTKEIVHMVMFVKTNDQLLLTDLHQESEREPVISHS